MLLISSPRAPACALLLTFIASFLALATTARNAFAQAPGHEWSRSLAGTEFDQAYSVAVSNTGIIYIAGSYEDDVPEFGPSAGGKDIFLASYDTNGALLWAVNYGGVLDDEAYAVDVDDAGFVYITGSFDGTLNIVGPPLVSAGSTDVFFAQFNSGGVPMWSRRVGGTSLERVWSLAVDGAGNINVAGEFLGTTNLGGVNLGSVGGLDMFLARYNASGAHQWSKRFGSTGTDSGHSVAIDAASGNVHMTGLFHGTVNFGGGNLVSAGVSEAFITEFSSAGVLQWSKRVGGTNSDEAHAIAVDGSGNVFVTGQFAGTANFGGVDLTSAGFFDTFLAKYNTLGTHQWSYHFGGAGSEFGEALATDASGNVALAGWFDASTVNFGGNDLESAGFGDIFLARFDAAGTHVWSQSFGDVDDDIGYGVAVDGAGDVILTGFYMGSVDFGGGVLPHPGGLEIVTAKFTGDAIVGVGGGTPDRGALAIEAYPNPFNPRTTIRYTVPSRGAVTVAVYDARGAHVATLFDGERAAGAYTVDWEGQSDDAAHAASGIYFARIEHASGTRSKKMVLLK